MTGERKVLIFDALNVFIRAYAAYPQMNVNGEQMGGLIGTLKTIRRLVAEVQPSRAYVCWETGGSTKRRALFSDYKKHRKPGRLNRFYDDDIPESDENRKFQQACLVNALKHVPVCQVYVPDCEGDDVVAYLCKGPFNDREKVIVSSDHDMWQLIDDKTIVYNLHKKVYLTADNVYELHKISSRNFAVAKALAGDNSDNIPGVKGVGLKSAAKYFPMLGTDSDVLLEDVFNYAASHRGHLKVYDNVLEAKDDVIRNYRLVYLSNTTLSSEQARRVNAFVERDVPKTNKLGLMRDLIKNGINDFDIDGFFYAFNCIDVNTKSE